ncbi:MAG: hypothetical protein KDD99_31735 [Bacteroidetes bacterium]|nr:hypothetical protein [Bacteroidota bacterium]
MENKIVLTQGKVLVGTEVFNVTYYDNPTSRSLVAQMPFTVELEDYAGIEKIFYPKESLSKEGAPKGADPSVGDIMYYAPWGDVAIFYKDFSYANGLIPLGYFDDIAGFMNALKTHTSTVTFEKSN